MLKQLSGGVDVLMPVDQDMDFKVVDMSQQRGTYFSANTQSLVTSNKYMCCMAGGMSMLPCSLTSKTSILLKLPFSPKFGEVAILADLNSSDSTRRFVVDSEGNLKPANNMSFKQGDFLSFHATFPISTGGGLLSRVIQRIRTLGKKVCVC